MKILKINNWFRKFGQFQIKYRWALIIAAALITLFGIMGLQYLQPQNARESWFEDNEAIEINTKKFEEQFGNNDNIVILIESKDVFHPEVLKMMQNLGNELLDSIPYSDEITSLADMEVSVGTQEGIQVINPFEDGIPEDAQRLEEIRKLVLSRRALANKIVSDDCTEALLILSLYEFPKEEEWSKETTKDPLFQVGEVALRIINNPKWQSEHYTLKAAGMPYSETEERDYFSAESQKRLLFIFLAMIILLTLFTRSWKGVIIPILTILISMIVDFGFMGWLGIGYETNMIMLPLILGMSLSVGYSLHLFNAFKRFFRKTGNRRESVIAAVEETGWPLFFTALTTIGSVASFATVGIPAITWVGFACGSIVLANFLFVIILLPITLSFGKNRELISEKQSSFTSSEQKFEALGRFILGRKYIILISFIILVGVILPGLSKVYVDIDPFKSMGRKIPYINRLYDITQSKLGAYFSYNISIDFDEQDKIKEPEVLKRFDTLLDSIRNFELTKKIKDNASVFSVLDIVKEMNQTLHSDSSKYYCIPDTKEEIAQILLLYEMSGGTKTFNWIDEDYSMMRAQISLTNFLSKEVIREEKIIQEMSPQLFPSAKITAVGSAMQFAEVNNKIVIGEIKSITVSLLIITILLILVFGSIKTGLIGLIPNLAPMIVIGGYMGYTGTPLNMMTMTIVPMLLGIAVDDTIHFINSIKYEFEKSGNYRKAILSAFHTVGKTLAMTTIVLSVSFAVYMTSPVNMMALIGLLSSMGLLVALITDYFITPVLIILTKPFGKEK